MRKHTGLTERQRYWATHIEAAERGGDSLKAYADTHGLDVQSLYRAKSHLRSMGYDNGESVMPTTMVRVAPDASVPSDVMQCRITFASGASVEVACAPQHWTTLLDGVATLR